MSVDICSPFVQFPFLFYEPDGNGQLSNGTLVGEDTCVFSEAHCDPSIKASQCCGINNSLVGPTGENYMFVCWVFFMAPFAWSMYAIYGTATEEEKEQMAQEDAERLPWYIRRVKTPWLQTVLVWTYFSAIPLSVGASVVVPMILKRSEQTYMSASERTALQASEAFMDPYHIVFNFIQDIVMIRIMYASSTGDQALMNKLVHAGLAGVVVSGFVAGILGTLLGAFPASLEALTLPGKENDVGLYPGCDYIESKDVSNILPYWMLEVWDVIGCQIGGVVVGYLMGSLEYVLCYWMLLLSKAIFCAIWFGNVRTASNLMTLLGIGEFTERWLVPILTIAYLVSPLGSEIGERTGVKLSFKKVCSYFLMPFQKSTGDKDPAETARDKQETMALLKEGLKLLFINCILQLCYTASSYLALTTDGAIAYQITALQSEILTYGPTYTFGMAICVKMMGAIFLANGMPQQFVTFIYYNLVALFLLICVIIGSTLPFYDELALRSGANACVYASSEECVPFFTTVFGQNGQGGLFSLQFTYQIFTIAACLDAILLMLQCSLLVCLDFDFLLYATIAAGLSYIPAIAVVQYAPLDIQSTAIAYYGANYVPVLVMVILLSIRLTVVLGKISRQEDGPWTQKKERRLTTVPSHRQRSMANGFCDLQTKAIATATAEQSAADYSAEGLKTGLKLGVGGYTKGVDDERSM